MFWVLLLLLAGCSEAPTPDCDWTWIEEEWCLMDICGQQTGDHSECRQDGECWCCDEDRCWFSGRAREEE